MKETTDAELIEIKISPHPFEGNRRQVIWEETKLRLSAGLPAFNFYPNPVNNIICGVFFYFQKGLWSDSRKQSSNYLALQNSSIKV